MSLVIIPELVLLDTINKALSFVRKNYANASDKTKTFLYYCFNGIIIDNYNVLEQSVAIICNKNDDPRFFVGDIMFNSKKQNVPSFHITLPAESLSDGNSIGSGEDSWDNIVIPPANDTVVGTVTPVFERRIQTNYNIVIASDNSMEIVVLYHFMRAILISCIPHLHLSGLQNIGFAGQDIQPYTEATANQLYMRAISLSLQYDTKVPFIFSQSIGNDITVDGEPIDEDES